MENCERVKNQFSEFLTANPDNEMKFFVKFLLDNPPYMEKFPQLKNVEPTKEALMANDYLKNVHVRKVTRALKYIVDNLDNLELVRNEVVRIFNIENHINHEIYETEYEKMITSLIEMVEECCPGFTNDDRTRWLETASLISDIFNDKALLQVDKNESKRSTSEEN